MTMALETVDSTKDQRFLQLFQSSLAWFDSVRYRNAESAPYYVFIGRLPSSVYSQWEALREADTQFHSLVHRFVDRVSHLIEIELIFWKLEHDRICVWTIIDQPNLQVENQIYDSQLAFMDMFPELSCDFAVIFRQGKASQQVCPEGAKQVFSRT